MAARSTTLTKKALGKSLDWVERSEGAEPFELAAQELGYAKGAESVATIEAVGIPLRWVGEGAKKLGLTGETSSQQAHYVLGIADEVNGRRIKSNYKVGGGKKAVDSYGLVLSPPKTISMLLADKELAKVVSEAHEAALEIALQEYSDAQTVRAGRGGVKSMRGEGLIGVAATHYTSAAGEPHLHAHVFYKNSMPCEDGEARALDGRVHFSIKRVIEARYNAEMKQQLTERLGLAGVDWTPKQVGSVTTWELTRLIPDKDKFSNSRQHMLEVIKEKMEKDWGFIGDISELTAEQQGFAWRLHREHKQEIGGELREKLATLDSLTPAEQTEVLEHAFNSSIALEIQGKEAQAVVREFWEDRLSEDTKAALAQYASQIRDVSPAEIGKSRFKQGVFDEMVEALREEQPTPAQLEKQFFAKEALFRLVDSKGAFRTTDVVAFWTGAGADVEQARSLTYETLASWERDELVVLPVDKEDLKNTLEQGFCEDTSIQQRVFGNQAKIIPTELLKQELEILDMGQELTKKKPVRGIHPIIDPEQYTKEQVEAIKLLSSGRGLVTIQGVAGAGKTTILKPVIAERVREGQQVRVITRNAKLAVELGQDLNEHLKEEQVAPRVAATTIASFTTYPPKTAGETWIIDEAAVVDAKDWKEIFELAIRNRCQVVAIGDYRQTQSIDKLGAWPAITKVTEPAGCHIELEESWRCKVWKEEHDLVRERSSEAIKLADRDGRVVASRRADEEMAEMIATSGENRLALVATNAEAVAINAHIQALRRIIPDERAVLRWEDQYAGIGDIVRTRANDYRRDVFNGESWKVIDIRDEGISVRHIKDGRERLLSYDWCAQNLELGYASTVDSAQGLTVDRAIIRVSEHMSSSQLYSGITRGTKPPIYVVEAEGIEDAKEQVIAALQRDDIALSLTEQVEEIKQFKAQRQKEKEREQRPPQRQVGSLDLGVDGISSPQNNSFEQGFSI